MKRQDRIYLSDSTYLTRRGETVLGTIVILGAVVIAAAALGFLNVNFATPDNCRDGWFAIKDTPACKMFLLP